MTREEAIAKFGKAGGASFSDEAWIDRFVALGLLKLDEPKTVEQAAIAHLSNQLLPICYVHRDGPNSAAGIGTWKVTPEQAKAALDHLAKGGFKIVRAEP